MTSESQRLRDRGAAASEEIAEVAAPLLGWDETTRTREVDSYRQRAAAVLAAEQGEHGRTGRLTEEDLHQ